MRCTGQRLTWAREEEGELLKVSVCANAQCPFRKVLALYRRVAVAVHDSLLHVGPWPAANMRTSTCLPVCMCAVHARVQFAEHKILMRHQVTRRSAF